MTKLSSAAELFRAILSPRTRGTMLRAIRSEAMMPDAQCPCCGYSGAFDSSGSPVRVGALCPRCKSLERHRLFKLAHDAGRFTFRDKDVLHFAPEKINAALIKSEGASRYRSADIEPGKGDLVLNIEDIALDDASVDMIVCSHVLEHVDDRKAIPELSRILKPGGQLVAMVPLVAGWPSTYEQDTITSDRDRWRHFGLSSHVRFYGADFTERLRAQGFQVAEFTADGRATVAHNLERGDKVFIGQKGA